MHVLIPVGGRGKRLRPLTDHLPKPLLPLGGRPILSRILEALPPALPVTLVVVPELAPEFRRWKGTLPTGRDVRLYVERPVVKGPTGPVVGLATCSRDCRIDTDLLVLMGDSLLPFTLDEFLAGIDSRPRLAAYPVQDLREATRFGVLEIAGDETVLSFEEKPVNPRSRWVFTGCVSLPARLLPSLHRIAQGGPQQVGHLIAQFLEMGEMIEVFRAGGEWHDIGTFESYLAAHRPFLSPEMRAELEWKGNSLEGVVYVEALADVRDSRLAQSLVGTRATVRATDLDNCIVMPGTHLAGRTVRNRLLAPEGEFPLTRVAGTSARS